MNKLVTTALLLSALPALTLLGCGDDDAATETAPASNASGAHAHDDGSTHDDHGDHDDEGDDHHDETSLGAAKVGDMDVEFAQGHGAVEAGKEGHLVIKLPYNDKGQSIVRVWIGTDDRDQYLVAKAEYAPDHDDYDAHAMAPNPLPENVMWWVEVEKPDGTISTGSVQPQM